MMCDSGRIETNRLLPGGMVTRHRSVDARSIAWVTVTPLGLPVEPEVQRISIGSSGAAGVLAARAATADGSAGSTSESRSRTGRSARWGMVIGSSVAPVPRRIAAGWVSAEIRSTVSWVIRASSGTRMTFALAAAKSAAAKPGPGAPCTSTRAPGGSAAASRAAAWSTAAPKAANVSDSSRAVELRTPRNGAEPLASIASDSRRGRVGASAGRAVGFGMEQASWGARRTRSCGRSSIRTTYAPRGTERLPRDAQVRQRALDRTPRWSRPSAIPHTIPEVPRASGPTGTRDDDEEPSHDGRRPLASGSLGGAPPQGHLPASQDRHQAGAVAARRGRSAVIRQPDRGVDQPRGHHRARLDRAR